MSIDWNELERRWQTEWDKAKVAEAVREEGKKKFYMVFAYPYPTGFLHTGHMRGYTYADMITRFKRLAGYNAMLPIGIHATGNGVIAKAQLIARGDEKYINYLRENNVPEEDIKKLTDPETFVRYFGKLYVRDMKRFGILINERTYVTTIDRIYNKFIEWQFHKLMDLGLLIQKEYYATYCENCGPVSVDPAETDVSKGGNAEKIEYTLLKFRTDIDNYGTVYLIAATLRPETVFGQTNLWVDPDEEYVVMDVEGETWVGSKPFAEKIKYQKDRVEIKGTVKGSDLIGKYVTAPGIMREIIVLPSKFCDPNVGSGIVTSVPSDAPHDWMGLYDLQNHPEECKKYGLNCEEVQKIQPIPIIETPGWGEFPAKEICEKMGITSSTDPKLEDAKKEIYKSGYYKGVMRETTGKYAGMPVEKAKELVKQELIKEGLADIFYDLSEEVICRCGGRVFIKKVDHQWFIDYSKDWLNERAIEWGKQMNVKPQEYYEFLPDALRWFKERPCARMGRWLGTKFPFDERYTIEAISDSTLYPIFYLVSMYKDRFTPEQLTLKFFDYVFLGKGDAKSVAEENGMDVSLVEEIKKNVWYWYPLDINLGGKEHTTVHFPPFVKNHVAILPKELWPRGIFVNYWIISHTKEKLSKSKGGAQPVPGMAERYGVDPMRLFYANIAKPYVDVEFDEKQVFEYRERLEWMYNEVKRLWELSEQLTDARTHIDDWLEHRIKAYLWQIEKDIDSFELKHATDIVYYRILSDIQWYLKRKGRNREVLRNTIKTLVQLMSPFTPHLAEEIWHTVIGESTLVCQTKLPPIEKTEFIEKDSEWYIKKVTEDVNHILKVIKKEPKKITFFVSAPWKREMVRKALTVEYNMKSIMDALMTDRRFEEHKREIATLIKKVFKMLPEYRDMPELNEEEILTNASEYFKERFDAEIVVMKEGDASDPKAKNALPLKPAIKIE